MKKVLSAAALAALVSSCATTSDAELHALASSVTVTSNHDLARGCRFIGQEEASVNFMTAMLGSDAVRRWTRVGAARKGANLLVSAGPQVVSGEGAGRCPLVTMVGDAYACPPDAAP